VVHVLKIWRNYLMKRDVDFIWTIRV
jgi:hypothetical protein